MTDQSADMQLMPQLSDQELLETRVRLPQHRSFVAETVVLNLRTGKYHGLNPTAGKMLEALDAAPSVGEAVPVLAAEYDLREEQIQGDLLLLTRGLLERELIVATDDSAA
jgi:hypothetical protein